MFDICPWIDPRIETVPLHPRRSPPLAAEQEELNELMRACREGRLYEVERWIQLGRPLQWKPMGEQVGRRQSASALQVAIESDQDSLFVLLLANGFQWEVERNSLFDLALKNWHYHLLDPLFA